MGKRAKSGAKPKTDRMPPGPRTSASRRSLRRRSTGTLPGPRAMVMAAGLGTRLRPLTEHIPKPLVPVAGRPLLENAVVNLRAAGAGGIAVNTHHLHEQVERFARSIPGIRLYHEPRILGVGGGLANAREFLSKGDYFLFHNADALTDIDIPALVRDHEEHRPMATLALIDGAFNRVLVSGRGEVLDIVGKLGVKSPARSRTLTFASIAVFSPELFDFLPKKGSASLVEAMLQAVRRTPGCVRGFLPGEAYWNTVESLADYRKVHEDVLIRRSIRLRGVPVSGPFTISEEAEVAPDARLSGFVSIGPGCRVESGAELTDCVLLPRACVRAGEGRRQAVLGEDFIISIAAPPLRDLGMLRERGFGPGVEFAPLVEMGSDRQFYRISDGKRSEVLTVCPKDDPDFDRYVRIGRFLHAHGLGAPEILAVDGRERCVLVEDLGDAMLYLQARAERDADVLEGLYTRVVDLLAEMQAKATAALDECPEAAERVMDYEHLRWETSYFRENFLERLLKMPEARTCALEDEFHRLALDAAAQPRVFMHRDFQSQNILIQRGEVRVVDFQGARLGPVAYDLASLLKDAYVALTRALRDRLAERFRVRLRASGGQSLTAEELGRHLLIAGLQRNMQALGAFCFLWLKKGKPQFKRFIRPALAHLEDGLTELGGEPPGPLPALSRALADAGRRLDAALAER